MGSPVASEQAYRQLVTALRGGIWGPGRRLPGERALAAQFGVSRETVRNALRRLADERLLESVAGSGWFIASEMLGEPPSVLQTFTEMAHARGLRPTAEILVQEARSASLEEADALHVPPASEVLELVRIRGLDHTPICLDRSVMSLALVRGIQYADLRDRSLYQELADRCGIRIARSAYAVRAEVADAELASQLKTMEGFPILVGEEIGYTGDGRPVLLGTTQYRGDAYHFRADLFRPL